MRIAIVGGGALGLLHAARLAAAGHAVRVWTRTEEQAAVLAAEGIRLEDGAAAEPVRVAASASGSFADAGLPATGDGLPEAVLLAVKQTAIGPPLFRLLGRIAGRTKPVICLQNGIGHMEALRAALPETAFAAGVTTEGATRTGMAAVRHSGRGRLVMEPARGIDGTKHEPAPDAQKMLVEAMRGAGMEASLSNDITTHVRRKLGVNAVLNPLTALFGVRNGELPAAGERLALMDALCAETAAVLAAAGTPVGDLRGDVLRVCAATAGNVSSMLADVRAGRPTEADWISGGIVRLARGAGVPAPLNEAAAAMIRAMSPRESERTVPKER